MILLLILACQGDDDAKLPGEDFRDHESVRVTWPTNGETVESPFVLLYSAGEDVARVHLEAAGETVVPAATVEGGEGELVVELEPGSAWPLALVGEDAAGVELSRHELTVRVATPAERWVTIASPSDGAEVPNPVNFVVSASDGVDRVELYADGWLFGEVAPGEVLSYEFTGTGYARAIEARAYVEDEVVATDAIALTVEPGTAPEVSSFNDVVLRYVDEYPTDGSYGYWWPDDVDWFGTTRDVWYLDTLVAEGDPEHRSYCVGLTWEVFMRAFDEVDRSTGGDGSINGMDVADLDEFRIDWFVRDLWGMGPVDAVENYGIGTRVTDWADVRAGDFIQFWRHSGSGHNAIFVEWTYDGDGDVDGLTYWSTQGSTDGIDYNSESFGSSGSTIDPNFVFVARVATPEDWIGWR